MSKVLKIAGEVIAIGALAVVTAGAGAALIGGATLAGSIGAGLGTLTALAGSIGLSLGAVAAIGTGLTLAGGLLQKKPEVSSAQLDRTNVSLVLDAPRKIVFGHTALATDLRYQELWGAEQEYLSQVMVVAGHWVEAIEQVWFNDQLAWDVNGGVQGTSTGYLLVAFRAQATSASSYPNDWSNRWGANAVFTGCATLYLQFKLTGNSSKASSPFSSSVPSRVTVRGKAARLYDPRLDSTVGGAGAMRVADQSTWAWAASGIEVGRNPALCLLFYLLGWRIQNPVTGQWKLAVGLGIPADRIDLGSFMTAANMCDEPVALLAGGTEPRYRCDGMFSEADDPGSVITALEACMNAKLRDSAGRFTLQVMHNDLATPILDFTEDDVLDDFIWDAGGALNELKNVVKGRYTDGSNNSLYQLVDYPPVSLPALDGIDRIETFEQALVQSPSQATRLASQRLQRYQYPGTFAGNFKARAWAVKDGDIVRLTFPALGMAQKLFRITKATVQVSGVVPLVLAEENAAIYAWDRGEGSPVVAAAPNTFDPLLLPIPLAIDDAAETAKWPNVTGPNRPADNATNSADPNSPFGSGTVGGFTNRVVTVESILGPGGYVQTRFTELQEDIDNAGGGTGVSQQLAALEASARGAGNANPNLLLNPQFADTLLGGWTAVGSWGVVGPTEVGNFAQSNTANSHLYQDVAVTGGSLYSLSAEMDPDQAQGCFVKVDWFNAGGGNMGANGTPPVYADGWARGFTADNAMQAPNGAAKARIYCQNAVANSYGRFTRVQFQRGGVPSAFRDDGDAFYSAARFNSEVTLRNSERGNYTQKIDLFTSQFAGGQDSWLKSTISNVSGVASGAATTANTALGRANDANGTLTTVSSQVNTLTSTINSLGAPNLINNPEFISNFDGWTGFGTSWSLYNTGSYIFAQADMQANQNQGIYFDVPIQQGKPYCLSYEGEHDAGCLGHMVTLWLDSSKGEMSFGPETPDVNAMWGNRVTAGPFYPASGAAYARVFFYAGRQGNGKRRFSKVLFQQSTAPTPYVSYANIQGLQAQVTQQAGTIATLQGYLGAYFSIQANAGDATAFVSVRAQVNGGTTSDVSIGAKEFLVYNDVNGQLLKTFVASGGNVRIYGNLELDGAVSTHNLQDTSVTKRYIFSGGGQVWQGDGYGGGFNPPGGGGSSGCPSADTPILLANKAKDGPGETRPAGRLVAGDTVWTQHEATLEWGAFEVVTVRHFWGAFHGSEARPRTTGDHPFWIDGEWKLARDLGPVIAEGPAVQLLVDQAHTFVSLAPNGQHLLSHNKTTEP